MKPTIDDRCGRMTHREPRDRGGDTREVLPDGTPMRLVARLK